MMIIDPPIYPRASAATIREFLAELEDTEGLDAEDLELVAEVRAEAEYYLREREEKGPDAFLGFVDGRRFWSVETLRRELAQLDDLEARVRSGTTPVWPGKTRAQRLEMLASSRQAMEHWLDVGGAAGGR